MSERIFIKGNEAIAHGALAAGCRCYFGYPITPQNEIPEFMAKHMPAAGGAFVQAESELAAINMVLGACATGTRSMTSSSGLGISLMQESISYMAGSEIPAVFVNMMRGGPGLGDINTAQGDYYQATRGGGHGDYRTLTLAPSTGQEAYDLTRLAFELAFKYRNPTLVLGDAILGQMKEPVTVDPPAPQAPDEAADWRLNGCDGRPRRVHKSIYLAEGELAALNIRLQEKFRSMDAEVRYEALHTEDAELVAVAFGSIGRIVKTAVRKLRAKGHKVGLLRPITLYPFPEQALRDLAYSGKRFLTLEHNMGQMVDDVRLAVRGLADSDFFGALPGNMPFPDEFEAAILRALQGGHA